MSNVTSRFAAIRQIATADRPQDDYFTTDLLDIFGGHSAKPANIGVEY